MDKEQIKKLKRKHGKKSLPIRVMECELYDWKPGVRLTLLVLALGKRTDPEAWIQEDCPWTAEEMVGWCDMAQWRLALRVGKSEDQIGEDVAQFVRDGVVEMDEWTDSNNAKHNRYRIVEAVIDENQRQEQKKTVERPSRYKVKRGPNKGSFSYANQPGKSRAVREMDEEEKPC